MLVPLVSKLTRQSVPVNNIRTGLKKTSCIKFAVSHFIFWLVMLNFLELRVCEKYNEYNENKNNT